MIAKVGIVPSQIEVPGGENVSEGMNWGAEYNTRFVVTVLTNVGQSQRVSSLSFRGSMDVVWATTSGDVSLLV